MFSFIVCVSLVRPSDNTLLGLLRVFPDISFTSTTFLLSISLLLYIFFSDSALSRACELISPLELSVSLLLSWLLSLLVPFRYCLGCYHFRFHSIQRFFTDIAVFSKFSYNSWFGLTLNVNSFSVLFWVPGF